MKNEINLINKYLPEKIEKEKRKKYYRQYYLKNREKINEKNKLYYRNNKDTINSKTPIIEKPLIITPGRFIITFD